MNIPDWADCIIHCKACGIVGYSCSSVASDKSCQGCGDHDTQELPFSAAEEKTVTLVRSYLVLKEAA